MGYSLINVRKQHDDGTVEGSWMQDCNGVTLEVAIERARGTERVNSNNITVAVTDQLPFFCEGLSYATRLPRLG